MWCGGTRSSAPLSVTVRFGQAARLRPTPLCTHAKSRFSLPLPTGPLASSLLLVIMEADVDTGVCVDLGLCFHMGDCQVTAWVSRGTQAAPSRFQGGWARPSSPGYLLSGNVWRRINAFRISTPNRGRGRNAQKWH